MQPLFEEKIMLKTKPRRMAKYAWDLCYDPITVPGSSDYRLFDNMDRESAYFVQSMKSHCVWTQIQTNKGPILRPGRRKGIHEGYVVTLRPWSSEMKNLIVS